ncbi:MAG: hypothetical protein JO210_01955 [Acidobacteriaceae bacterium]|nr:hypothetical protein [Acidobacteriaceae bacterium]
MPAFFCSIRCLGTYKLIKVAFLSACRLLLVEQRKPALVEFFKELIPCDLLEIGIVASCRARKFDPQNPDISLGPGA